MKADKLIVNRSINYTNRIFRIISILILMFFIFNGYDVKADDKNIYTVYFSIEGNADLENRDINILFEYKDKNTALITLKSLDDYKKEQLMLEGETIVKQISIIGDIGQYKYSYNKEFDITENSEFILKIDEQELESVGEKINNDIDVIDSSKKDKTDNNKEKSDSSKSDGYEKILVQRGENFLGTLISTSVAISIVGIIFLLYKWKNYKR